MRSAPRADHTASGAAVQKLRHGTKRKCNILQEAPIGLQQLAHAQAEVTLEEVEQQCPRYIVCLKTLLRAVENFEDGDSDSDSEVMTYYTDTDPETEPTIYSFVANAAVKTGEEFDGKTLRNDEAHETAHPMDTNTSLDESPADVEFSQITEDASASHQAQAIEETSKVTEEREISDEPAVSGFAEVEMQHTPTMVSLEPDITQVSGHPENSNIRDHIRGLSQPLQTIQSSEHPKPFDTTEVIRKAQEDRLWTPLIQPSEQANTENKTIDEETLYLPGIAARMSSDANMAEWCNQQRNVSPVANIAKEVEQLYPPGSLSSALSSQHPEASAVLLALLSSIVGGTLESNTKNLISKRSRSPKDDTDHTSSVKIPRLPSIIESGTSSFTNIIARKESPWEIYEKILDLDLNGFVTVAQRKARHSGLVAVRAFRVADAEKTLYMHRRVQHANIVEALDAFTTETSFFIILEHMPFSLDQIILDGLVFLEREGFEHGSLDCSNVVLSSESDVKIANQQFCDKPQRNQEPRDVRALGIITMELMQKYTQDNGAVGVENFDRWPSDSDAVAFLSETTSAASARELRE
ncbi:hypothetical protein ACLOAV_009891 [Pseudogymnoascus australis]